MADKVIQMQVRNEANTAWDNLNPRTKASAVLMGDGRSVEESVSTHLVDYTQHPYYAGDTGSTGTGILQITLPVTYSSWSAVPIGACFSFKNIYNNQTIASGIKLALAGLAGEKPILKSNGNLFTTLTKDAIYTVRWNGVNFILQGEGASGNATASDLLLGKTATTDAGEITGTMPNRSAVVITPSTTNQVIPEGYHNGSGYVVGEPNLIPTNILSGTSIFGVSGSVLKGVVISSIQHGTGTMSDTSVTINISPVDIDKSILLVSSSNGTSTPSWLPGMMCRGEFLSSFQIKLTRYDTSDACVYYWTVITFSEGVSIQRGFLSSSKQMNFIPITAVNPSRSVLFHSACFSTNIIPPCYLMDASNIFLAVNAGTVALNWQVLSFI